MMIRALILWLLILPVTAGATGLGEADEPLPEASITLTDALDRTITLPGPPRRLVTAGRAVLMIADVLYAFETAPDRLVGVGRISQGRENFLPAIDPDYDEKTILERSVGPEQIAALNPDAVILKTFMRESLGSRLEALGIPVVYVQLETPEQYQRDLRTLGVLLGEPARAEQLAQFYQNVVEEVTAHVATVRAGSGAPDTLLLYSRPSDGDSAFQVPPATWIQTRMIEIAGGNPVWRQANPGGGWGTVGFEQIAAWDPEHIMIVAYDGSAANLRDRLMDQPRWRALRAGAEGNIHAFPTDFYSWDQPDTRWILGLQWLAHTINPTVEYPRSMESAAREFFFEFYRLDDSAFASVISPMLTGDLD